ncbi:flagellar biosynthetic protein FliQ [Thermosulfidibacter takaii ABI70S6]|uniref:Flagellar biosynthetic protein FliQ n=1 Tax=Thermosulfidibacter takaii (strain DSM 17441 / JCM 13301 / NBRC 103674 / ABI70S6) TaxID=1298851 RepID=A0A0S3QSY8_THET7|nr:flagellar biosynthesis protein FliQ [Thermosulfidibacter takaii]BAT71451.1 flagellar biosynthetic protein FliQ [Thermosulfidibacter takaii ABI70S6]
MTDATVIEIGVAALKVALMLAAPVLITTMVVGLLIGVLQAATQIQEMTLTFVPKMLVAALTLILLGPWMIRLIVGFTVQLYSNIPTLLR